MAEEAVDAGGTGLGRTYRLAAPARQAFDPTQLELLTQQQIAQPDGGEMLGYHLLARTRAANNQQRYLDALGQTNAAQARGAAQQQAGDLTRAILASRNPGLAYNLGLTRQVIAPDRMENMRDWADVEQAGALAEVNNENAQANQRNAEAGVLPPQGTPMDRYSLPTRPRVQGATPAMMRAASSGGGARAPSLTALTGAANLFGNREQAIATAVQQAEGRLLAQIGVRNDMNGQLVVPPGVTSEQIADARNRARVEATAAVDRALAAARQVYERGGYGRILPDDVPRPVPQTSAPIVATPGAPVQPPNVAPAAPNAAPQTTAQPIPAPSVNQITPDRVQAVQRAQPPGAAYSEVSRTTGVVRHFDRAGNLLRVDQPQQ